jgi:predicted metal-binding membrane protein
VRSALLGVLALLLVWRGWLAAQQPIVGAARIAGPASVASAWLPVLVAHASWLGDWMLMCTVMMLPTTWPVLAALRRCARLQRHPWRLQAVGALAFLGVWGACGLVWRTIDSAVAAIWRPAPPWPGAAGLGMLCLLSGTYLLSPWADRCVRACRTPLGFIARHWTGGPDMARQAARIGLTYGLSCVGCCWPLMVTMGAIGLGTSSGMLGLALLMSLQKTAPWGRVLTRTMGLVLIAAGAAWAGGALPLPTELGALCGVR